LEDRVRTRRDRQERAPVPSLIACLASSPGRIRRTLVWISRDDIVDFFEYWASSEESEW
jgi:hypothetical protein